MVFMAIPAWLAFRNKLKGTTVVALLTFSIIVLSVQLRKGDRKSNV
jgi:hypothetical protein